MNRPMTSPWSAVLTSSPTITLTPYSAAFAARLERARDLVVVGHRDRAEALTSRAVASSTSTGVAQSCAVVGVHVQVDVDQLRRRCRRAARSAALPRARGGARPACGVERPRARRPRALQRAARTRRRAQALAQVARRRSAARSCAASVSTSLGSKSSAGSPSLSTSLVDGQARRRPARHRPPGADDEPGRRGDAVGGRDERRRRPPAPRRRASSAKRDRARAGRARSGVEEERPALRRARPPSQRSAGSETAQRAQEEPQGAALLLLDEGDAHRAPSSRSAARQRARRRARTIGTRREEAPQQVGASPRRSQCARRAARRPAARRLRATWWRRPARSARGSVPTLSAREWRSAALATLGANGSCTWQRSSAARLEKVGDRARDVDRQRRPAHRRAPRRGRQRLAHGRAGAPPPEAGSMAALRTRGATRAPARGTRRRHDDDPMAAQRELVGHARDERVDVVTVLPRIGVTWAMDSGSGTAGRIVLWARATAGAGRTPRARPARRVRRRARCRRSSRSMAASSRSPKRSLTSPWCARRPRGETSSKPAAQSATRASKIGGRDDLVDEAVALGPRDVAQGAGEQQLARRESRPWSRAWKLRAGVGVGQPDADLGRAEARAVGGDAQVAAGRELQGAADADPVDGREHRHRRGAAWRSSRAGRPDGGRPRLGGGARWPRTGRRRPRSARRRRGRPRSATASSAPGGLDGVGDRLDRVARRQALRLAWRSHVTARRPVSFMRSPVD